MFYLSGKLSDARRSSQRRSDTASELFYRPVVKGRHPIRELIMIAKVPAAFSSRWGSSSRSPKIRDRCRITRVPLLEGRALEGHRAEERGAGRGSRSCGSRQCRYCPRVAGSTPANVSRSTILNVPGAPLGSVGRQRGFRARYELRSAASRPRNTSATMRAPTPARCVAAGELGLFEDVVPQRRAALEADAERRPARSTGWARAAGCPSPSRCPDPTAATT